MVSKKNGFTPLFVNLCHKRRRAGFTLIELIMVILIVAILSVSGAFLMVYLVQNSVFIPNKLNTDMLAAQALDIMVEGDSVAKGIRFSKSIISISGNQVVFNNQDGQAITLRLDSVANKLYRSVNGGAEALIPYYAGTGVNITGQSGKLFTYHGANESETSLPADVRRIRIDLAAMTGSGSFDDWQGRTTAATSVAVHKFQ